MAYDYDRTHEKIKASAEKHFAAEGFAGASIRQICKDAGVTNGAFYAHFDSKEDLFAGIVGPVVDGMNDLYDEENSSYMSISSAEDVRHALDRTFSSNRKLIRYIYEHADIFRLILTAGKGTAYEGFVDSLAGEEARNTIEFLEMCRPYIDKTVMISESLIDHIGQFMVNSVFDGIMEGKTEEEVVRETEIASEFCLAGIRHFLGFKEN